MHILFLGAFLSGTFYSKESPSSCITRGVWKEGQTSVPTGVQVTFRLRLTY